MSGVSLSNLFSACLRESTDLVLKSVDRSGPLAIVSGDYILLGTSDAEGIDAMFTPAGLRS